MQPLLTELICLALTQLVELALVCVLAPRGERAQLARVFLCVNTLTQPLATLAHGSAGFVPAELGVVAAETVAVAACSPLSWPRAALVALLVNTASASFSL